MVNGKTYTNKIVIEYTAQELQTLIKDLYETSQHSAKIIKQKTALNDCEPMIREFIVQQAKIINQLEQKLTLSGIEIDINADDENQSQDVLH